MPIFLLAEAQKEKLKSYTALRKQREAFRKRLVDLIVNKQDEAELGFDQSLSEGEKEILRYYYYIRHGVDTVHVAPVDQEVLDKVRMLSSNRQDLSKQYRMIPRLSH